MNIVSLACAMALAVVLPARADVSRDIAVTAAADDRFSTLVAAAKAAGMVDALKAGGPITLFAPTNDAFAALPADALAALLRPENRDRLRRVLAHHVVAGRVLAEDLLPTPTAKTAAGSALTFGLRVGDANVVQADIRCSNGVIHAIDRVLLPPEAPRAPLPVASERIGIAIDRGVPLFNGGDPAGCAAVYATTARELMALPGALGELQAADLDAALAAPAADESRRAWALREAFDRVLADEAFLPRIEAPVPKGFPAPGPVGRVVEKSYPAYRAARAEGGNPFLSLFQHIQKKQVAMTTPVEMTMEPTAGDGMRALDMAFLYEKPTMGETGADGKVAVMDLPALTVLSIGMRGDRTAADVTRARDALESRLAKDGFERAGPFRMLGYNSPMVPSAQRFWELQIPVRRAAR